MGTSYQEWLSSTRAGRRSRRGALPLFIKTLKWGSRVVGRARVIVACEDDSQAIGVAMTQPFPAGCVLVAGGHLTSHSNDWRLDGAGASAGSVVALVPDGLVRYSPEIRNLDFAAWCRGTTPIASGKVEPGEVGGAIATGGALIREGDLVIADEDGVVIWLQAHCQDLLVSARA